MPTTKNVPKPLPHAQALSLLQKDTLAAAAAIQNNLAPYPDRQLAMAQLLKQPYCQETARTAALIITLALTTAPCRLKATHQWVLADRAKAATNPHDPTSTPILPLAVDLLRLLQGRRSDSIVRKLTATAHAVAKASRNADIAGLVLQKTLPNRRAHSAFYTKGPAAILMAHLAVPADDPRWTSQQRTAEYRIADYSCGSGALLIEASKRVQQLHRDHGGDPAAAHSLMAPTSITGCDISPAAAAIAAHSLAVMNHPKSPPASEPNILTLHYGPIHDPGRPAPHERPLGLGALDILDPASLMAQTPKRYALTRPDPEPHSFEPESQDLVLMNPPFTRYPNHKDADLNIPDENAGIHPTTFEEIQNITRKYNSLAKANGSHYGTGLGHTFINLALRAVKPGGTIALLLPSTILSSMGHVKNTTPKGWKLFRKQLLQDYLGVTVVTLAAYPATGSAFSQDTATADVIIVARKRLSQEQPDESVLFANLSALPADRQEAADLAEAIRSERLRTDSPSNTATPIRVRRRNMGILVREQPPAGAPWHTARVLDPDLVTAVDLLRQGMTPSSKANDTPSIPMTVIDKIGMPGPSHWTIRQTLDTEAQPNHYHDPGNIVHLVSGHSSRSDTTIASAPAKPCPIREGMTIQAEDLLQQAGLLHVNDTQSYNSQPTAACISETPRIAYKGWTTILMAKPSLERATALWMNTSIGLILHWATTSHNQTGLGTASKRQLINMPTLDLGQLTPEQIEKLDTAFTRYAGVPLLPPSEAWQDPNREDLDRTVLQQVLGLDDEDLTYIHAIRDRWCREPTVQGRHGSSNSRQHTMQHLTHSVETNPIKSRTNRAPVLKPPAVPTAPVLPTPALPSKNSPAISSLLLRQLADAIDAGEGIPDYRKFSLTNRKHGVAVAIETNTGWKKTFSVTSPDDLRSALAAPRS